MSSLKYFLVLILVCSLAKTQAQHTRDSIQLLDEIIITATKTPLQKAVLPYAVSTLDKEFSSRQLSRTVPESLFGMPGVYVQKTNHAGGSPFLRGLTGNQTLILVDGIRLNNSVFRYGPNQYLTLVDPFIVEKIEVVKGTGSVQYGSDAMTGVININTISLKLLDKPQWSEALTTRYIADGMEFSARPELKYEGKKFSFMVGGSAKNFGNLKGGDTTGFQRPSGYTEKSFDAKLLVDFGSGWNMNGAYQFLQQSNVPVYHRYQLENFKTNTSDPLSRGFAYIRLNKKFNGNHLKAIEMFISNQAITEQRFAQKNDAIFFRSEKDAVSTWSTGADINLQFFPWWSANTGVEIYSDQILSARNDKNTLTGLNTSLRGLYPNASRFQNKSAYELNHFQFGRFTAEVGLRYNMYKISLLDETLGSIKLSPEAMVFQGAISYKLSDNIHVFSNLSEGFRAPNLDDLGTLGVVDFRYEIPTYNLKPERSLNQEVGIKYAATKFSTELSLFNIRLYDLITRIKTPNVLGGYDVYKKINVDKGFIRGLEIQSHYLLSKYLAIHSNATYLYGESITKKEPLRRMPPFNARLGIDYAKGQFFVGLTYDHSSPQRRLAAADKADNRIPIGGAPGFNLVNTYAGFQLERIIIRTYLNNIFNTDYRTHGSGINGMGRTIGLLLSIRFFQLQKTQSRLK